MFHRYIMHCTYMYLTVQITMHVLFIPVNNVPLHGRDCVLKQEKQSKNLQKIVLKILMRSPYESMAQMNMKCSLTMARSIGMTTPVVLI
ncbi:hypothetical protein I7I48_09319 [Histoplasma ohiense]|nr:hypothetical protein I7I48_09319 [Histoplasma ohiense (nom. inval.)]